MAISKVVYGAAVLVDLTSDTVDAAHLAQGYTAHGADGEAITGTMAGGGASQKVLCGSSAPASSQGDDGDIYLLLSSGGTAEAYPASFTSTGMNSTSNLGSCIGVSAENGTATANAYSSGQNTTGYAYYSFDLSDIPADAVITSVACSVKAHEENASRSAFSLQLYAGSTSKGSATTVDGTSNAVYTLNTGSWSRAELDSLVLRASFGYYGGLVAGATLTVAYTVADPSASVTLTASSSGWSISGSGIYSKSGGSWSSTAAAALDTSIEKG